MDETEALCTNIGIMVNGELKCLGSLQHLKSKYGEGYTLLVKLSTSNSGGGAQPTSESDMEAIAAEKTRLINEFVQFILSKFKNSTVKENRDGFLNIHINDNSTHILASIFSLVERVKVIYSIEYYVVTQTKLEQIFLNFASKQIDPESRLMNKRIFSCC
jgi:ATP-binding cassette subfamily A (ABC1) protein 3